MAAQLGIDIGGTFTDAVLIDDGRVVVVKVPTRPDDIAAGFVDALAAACAAADTVPAALSYVVHGTTTATNAIVTRRLARTALVTNDGFRDLLEIGTQQRPNVYDLWTPHPPPLVAREDAFGVVGRIGPGGEELTALDEAGVRAVAATLAARGIEAVAVTLLHAYAEPRHERRIGELLAELLPGVPVSLSSEVSPEFREYLRASTTALNAALLPLVGRYVRALGEQARAAGLVVPVHLMQSNGGVAEETAVAELPVTLAASGPAAGVVGSAALGALVGEADLLTFDMGGTTADVALVTGGSPILRFDGVQGGHPVSLPQIDVLSIGAGGGSIARVDAFGALTVGPASAGALPGPAAYGRGGTEATVTDAHVVLGTLAADRLLGSGGTGLDADLARAAVRRSVGEPLTMTDEEAAAAIIRVANANMAAALRLVSIARGHDPRRLALVAIGGAGPMHGCAIAEDLGVPRVIVPRHPGVAAAFGLLLSDLRHDVRRSWLRPTGEVDPAELDAVLATLAERARGLAARAAHGVDAVLRFELDMRYRGQAYNLTVPLAPPPVTRASLDGAEEAFAALHERTYGYRHGLGETEIVTLRVTASATAPVVDWAAEGAAEQAPAETLRDVWSAGRPVAHRVLHREALAAGGEVRGPALVEQEDTTLVVPAGWRGVCAAAGTLVLRREEG